MTVHYLLQNVEFNANARNNEVIANAFKRATIHCDECEYPQNAARFRMFLHVYIKAKLKLHRISRKTSHQDHCNYRYCNNCINMNNQILEVSKKVSHNRWFLKRYWPCKTCIAKYNPTGRWNYPLPSEPEGQEFINVQLD